MLYKNMLFGGDLFFLVVFNLGILDAQIEEEFFIIKSAITRPYSEILSNHVCDF